MSFIRTSSNVSFTIKKKEKVIFVSSYFGSFNYRFSNHLLFTKVRNKIFFSSFNFLVKKAQFNSIVTLFFQSVLGSLISYRKQLHIVGTGYQVEKKANLLEFKLGFSHFLTFRLPLDVVVLCPTPKTIVIRGIDLQQVSSLADILRNFKFPNAYKKKGIYYLNENRPLKQGKKT